MTQPVQPQALPDLALWLTLQHQEEQQRIADRTAAGLALLWALLRFDRLDATSPAWLHAVTLQVEQQFRVSEQAAFDFVQGTKWAIEPLSAPLKKVATKFPTKDFQLAMRATGPAAVKRATGASFPAPRSDFDALSAAPEPQVSTIDIDALIQDVSALGKLNSTGAGVKFALNGGRGEVEQLVLIDAQDRFKRNEPIGWARVTEDSENGPCYFCALLASQGAVYYNEDSFERSNSMIRDLPLSQKTGEKYLDSLIGKLDEKTVQKGLKSTERRAFIGEGTAKVHDHCKCSLRPVYRLADKWDERARFFLRQWNKSGGDSPRSQINDFRRRYVKPPPYERVPLVDLPAVIRNRGILAERLGANSSQVAWYDRKIADIQSLQVAS